MVKSYRTATELGLIELKVNQVADANDIEKSYRNLFKGIGNLSSNCTSTNLYIPLIAQSMQSTISFAQESGGRAQGTRTTRDY